MSGCFAWPCDLTEAQDEDRECDATKGEDACKGNAEIRRSAGLPRALGKAAYDSEVLQQSRYEDNYAEHNEQNAGGHRVHGGVLWSVTELTQEEAESADGEADTHQA